MVRQLDIRRKAEFTNTNIMIYYHQFIGSLLLHNVLAYLQVPERYQLTREEPVDEAYVWLASIACKRSTTMRF